jgi:periplasmic nitrate reductase NapD
MSQELHVAGIIVHAQPASVQRVAAALCALPGAAVHAISADGKLVVTLEGASAREIAARMDDIQQLDTVLSASLVYQHNESIEAMMEEVSLEDDETGIH